MHFSQVPLTDAQTAVIRVPNDFSTIQAAIDAAQPGSTILVGSGAYFEHLTINKTLTLLGADKENTVIDGSNASVIVVIEADNVILDGFTLRNAFDGVKLINSKGSMVKGNIVTMNVVTGILLLTCSNNTVSGNIVSSTMGTPNTPLSFGVGIGLESSMYNTISYNVIQDCGVAFYLGYSSNDSIVGNVIGNIKYFEIDTYHSRGVFSNNFITNYRENNFTGDTESNVWSESGRGNFWNDYTGLDDGSGGRVAGDGVGDTDLPWHGVDNFPLVSPPSSFKVFWDNKVFPASLMSNSTVSAFVFDQPHKRILYNVTSPADSTGYFNLSISKALLSGEWTVLVDGTDYTAKAMIMQNQTYTSIYLTYNNSSHLVQINGTRVIPEYPFTSTALLAMLLALLTTTIASKITMRTNERQSIETKRVRTLDLSPTV